MPVKTVAMKQAHHHLGTLLDYVRDGNVILLENATRNKPIALLVPAKYLSQVMRCIREDQAVAKGKDDNEQSV